MSNARNVNTENVDTQKKTSWNRKFKTPGELEEKVDAYFKKCEETKEPLTITGLALALDTSRQTLLEYEGEVEGREKGEEYALIIKKAKLMCEHFAEQYLFTGKNVVGAIFVLKNGFGWRDKTELGFDSPIGKIVFEVVRGRDEAPKIKETNQDANRTESQSDEGLPKSLGGVSE